MLKASLLAQVKAAVPPLLPVPLAGGQQRLLATRIAIGYPPINALQDAARGNIALVGIYDRNIARNSTRWVPFTLSQAVTTALLESTGTPFVVPPLGNGALTLSLASGTSAPAVNDAVSCVVANGGIEPPQTGAQVVIAGAADTPSTMASKLAAAVNGDAVLSTWVSAAAAGAVVTLTSLVSAGPLTVNSWTGNNALRTRDIGRRLRQFAIMAWAAPDEARTALRAPIESLIQQLALNFGVTLSDGTMARILYVSDHDIEDAAAEDLLRADFFLSADYAITAQDVLYSVLAPIPDYSIS